MAIRLKDPKTELPILQISLVDRDLGDGQRIVAFKAGTAIGGYLHTRHRQFPEDTGHIVVVNINQPVRVTLTTISPDEIIAEGY